MLPVFISPTTATSSLAAPDSHRLASDLRGFKYSSNVGISLYGTGELNLRQHHSLRFRPRRRPSSDKAATLGLAWAKIGYNVTS